MKTPAQKAVVALKVAKTEIAIAPIASAKTVPRRRVVAATIANAATDARAANVPAATTASVAKIARNSFASARAGAYAPALVIVHRFPNSIDYLHLVL